jgi:hypothetical protein
MVERCQRSELSLILVNSDIARVLLVSRCGSAVIPVHIKFLGPAAS